MLRKKHYLALGAVTLVTALVLSLPSGAVSHLKLAISALFLPLFGSVHAARQLPERAANSLLPRSELLKEIETLHRENDRLKFQNSLAIAIARENDQLRALFNWQRQSPWKLKLANVIMREPANWWRTVQIDLGSRDGLRENLPVRTAAGLVGRVSSVSLTRSQIVLIGDPNCRVSATVENPARDIGVIVASGPVDTSLVDLTYLASSANLKAGQIVVTSGLGGVFPKGSPIGQIVDSRSVEYGLYTDARVKLNANLGSLEQVWVLMNPFQ